MIVYESFADVYYGNLLSEKGAVRVRVQKFMNDEKAFAYLLVRYSLGKYLVAPSAPLKLCEEFEGTICVGEKKGNYIEGKPHVVVYHPAYGLVCDSGNLKIYKLPVLNAPNGGDR